VSLSRVLSAVRKFLAKKGAWACFVTFGFTVKKILNFEVFIDYKIKKTIFLTMTTAHGTLI